MVDGYNMVMIPRVKKNRCQHGPVTIVFCKKYGAQDLHLAQLNGTNQRAIVCPIVSTKRAISPIIWDIDIATVYLNIVYVCMVCMDIMVCMVWYGILSGMWLCICMSNKYIYSTYHITQKVYIYI